MQVKYHSDQIILTLDCGFSSRMCFFLKENKGVECVHYKCSTFSDGYGAWLISMHLRAEIIPRHRR